MNYFINQKTDHFTIKTINHYKTKRSAESALKKLLCKQMKEEPDSTYFIADYCTEDYYMYEILRKTEDLPF